MTDNKADMGHEIEAIWPEVIDLPSLPSNQFSIVRTGDFVYLTFGEFRPPFLRQTNKEQKNEISYPIRPHASIVLTSQGHKALVALLLNALAPDDLQEILKRLETDVKR